MENLTFQELCQMNGISEEQANKNGLCRLELINQLSQNYTAND